MEEECLGVLDGQRCYSNWFGYCNNEICRSTSTFLKVFYSNSTDIEDLKLEMWPIGNTNQSPFLDIIAGYASSSNSTELILGESILFASNKGEIDEVETTAAEEESNAIIFAFGTLSAESVSELLFSMNHEVSFNHSFLLNASESTIAAIVSQELLVTIESEFVPLGDENPDRFPGNTTRYNPSIYDDQVVFIGMAIVGCVVLFFFTHLIFSKPNGLEEAKLRRSRKIVRLRKLISSQRKQHEEEERRMSRRESVGSAYGNLSHYSREDLEELILDQGVLLARLGDQLVQSAEDAEAWSYTSSDDSTLPVLKSVRGVDLTASLDPWDL